MYDPGKRSGFSYFRLTALIVLIASTAASLYFMFRAGQNQKSILLIVLFTGWVLSPFVVLLLAATVSKFRKVSLKTLYLLMLFIAIGSLVFYCGAVDIFNTKPAAKFLIVPFASWLLIGISIFVARSRKLSRND